MNRTPGAFLAEEGQPGAPTFWPMHHQPTVMNCMHWHGHLEVVYLTEGCLHYDLHGLCAELPAARIALFWAFFPHRVTQVIGRGDVYVLNVPSQPFRSWPISKELRQAVLTGSMVVADHPGPYGEAMMRAWVKEGQYASAEGQALVLGEIEHMTRRIDREGWHSVGATRAKTRDVVSKHARPSSRMWDMLRFIDQNFASDISVADISAEAGLHPNYAMTIFKAEMGTTIASYLTQVRLTEAQHLLLSTRKKTFAVAIEAGFGSQSRFFSIFKQRFGTTPTQYRRRSRTDSGWSGG